MKSQLSDGKFADQISRQKCFYCKKNLFFIDGIDSKILIIIYVSDIMLYLRLKKRAKKKQFMNECFFLDISDQVNKIACAHCKDENQPGHAPSRISVLCPPGECMGP